MVDTAATIQSRPQPDLLDPNREIEMQSPAYYAHKYGIPEESIRFIVTARHGQSLTNFINAYAGNVIQASVKVLRKGENSVRDWSLHPLGRFLGGVRDGYN
ncbi:MAG: hypothetical protein ACK559_13840, partial [bacterium]